MFRRVDGGDHHRRGQNRKSRPPPSQSPGRSRRKGPVLTADGKYVVFSILPLKADVDVTELMGNEIYLYLLTGKKQFVARVDPRAAARVGETLDMVINMDNMHLFDPQTEKTLDVIG